LKTIAAAIRIPIDPEIFAVFSSDL